MNTTEFDGDGILTDFLTDYIDKKLDRAERKAFETWLDSNKPEKEFAQKALLGKKALSILALKIKADKNFEARLALRIALNNQSESQQMSRKIN